MRVFIAYISIIVRTLCISRFRDFFSMYNLLPIYFHFNVAHTLRSQSGNTSIYVIHKLGIYAIARNIEERSTGERNCWCVNLCTYVWGKKKLAWESQVKISPLNVRRIFAPLYLWHFMVLGHRFIIKRQKAVKTTSLAIFDFLTPVPGRYFVADRNRWPWRHLVVSHSY